MKNTVLLLLSVIFLSSCGLSYYYPSTARVDKVLGVTQEGDTIQVPIDYFNDRPHREYDINLEYFYWRNDWFFYNPNIYNRRWFVNNWWWSPYTQWNYPTYIYRPRVQEPRRWRTKTNIEQRRRNIVQKRRRTVQPNRGRSNQQRTQVRTPNYVRPNTRGRVTTPPPTHSNRNSTVRRNRSTNNNRVIKNDKRGTN